MKIKSIFLSIIPLLISCAQPLTPEQYVRQFSASFDENASIRFDSLFESIIEPNEAFGEKFFLFFFQDDCSYCINLYPILKELSVNSNKYYDVENHKPFKFYTFYLNYQSVSDYNDHTLKFNNFENFNKLLEYVNLSPGPVSYYTSFGNPLTIATPTLLFFDINESRTIVPAIQAIWVSIPGNNAEIIQKLAQLWDYTNLVNTGAEWNS
jgi:hypothetical protein